MSMLVLSKVSRRALQTVASSSIQNSNLQPQCSFSIRLLSSSASSVTEQGTSMIVPCHQTHTGSSDDSYRTILTNNSTIPTTFLQWNQSSTTHSFIRPYSPLISSSIGSDVEMIAANHRIAPFYKYRYNNNSTSIRTYSSTRCVVNEMKDEYGTMDSSGNTYRYDGEFVLENGQSLQEAELRYQTYGTLNTERNNVLVVCHALTGNASLHSWWGELLGPGKAFDTNKYFIICCNILGSCYGSTNPTSIDPITNKPYGINFPDISVQDTVRLQLHLLQDELNVTSIKCVIGGSFGGMQSLEYAVQGGSTKFASFYDTVSKLSDRQPYVKSFIPIACGSHHTAWQIGISEVQRQAIYKDDAWRTGHPEHATNGLEIARQIGMISYRTATGYVNKFGRQQQQQEQSSNNTSTTTKEVYGSNANWNVKTYLEYQGSKFLTRFDPITYVKLTEQMDSHNIARGRASTVVDVLQSISIPSCVLGIDSDVLYPIYEQEQLATHLPNGTFHIIHSIDGHDGFLLEQEQVSIHIQNFLNQQQ